MANNLGGQIIGELGDIAKDVAKQAVQVPKDIVGKALESMGGSSGNKQGASKFTVNSGAPDAGGKPSAWDQIGSEKDVNIKRSIARRALEELAGGGVKKQREPSIWERLQQEQEQKKQMLGQQKAASDAQSLPMPTSKRPKGDLYGKKAKSTAMENKSLRQD
jgi:hypothetical protein